MVYQIILNNGNVINCFSEDIHSFHKIISMEDNFYIVEENEQPKMTTYILKENVSHFRVPNERY